MSGAPQRKESIAFRMGRKDSMAHTSKKMKICVYRIKNWRECPGIQKDLSPASGQEVFDRRHYTALLTSAATAPAPCAAREASRDARPGEVSGYGYPAMLRKSRRCAAAFAPRM